MKVEPPEVLAILLLENSGARSAEYSSRLHCEKQSTDFLEG